MRGCPCSETDIERRWFSDPLLHTRSSVTLIYVQRRNLTVSLPADTIRKARIYAAQHDMTLNRLVQDLLDEKVSQRDRVRAASAKLLELAERGPHFRGDPGSIDRDELHERG